MERVWYEMFKVSFRARLEKHVNILKSRCQWILRKVIAVHLQVCSEASRQYIISVIQ